MFTKIAGWKRQFQLRILSRYRANFRRELAKAGMKTPDGCIGIAATGGLTLESFQALLEKLPEGTWEFVSHPGYNDAELDRVRTRLRDSREKRASDFDFGGGKRSRCATRTLTLSRIGTWSIS